VTVHLAGVPLKVVHRAPRSVEVRARGTACYESGIAFLVARIWRTGLDRARAAEYDEFARTRSLPMFERHEGFLGVLFATAGDDRVVITLWRDREAVVALEHSSEYRATARAIQEAGFLRPPQRVDVLDVSCARVDGLDR
jgi:heme-degrading monooxygenase HmoA